MSAPRSESEEPALDTLILAAFRQAQREGANRAAEHLLCALEALVIDIGSPACASACLDEAYLDLAGVARGTARARHRGTM
ncbi:hypothetical protein H0176_17945 [Methylorubrum populi]|uniref:Uncharacterized protein n=1 Tax=Methylorubrum rhodesianum TaxID=29427 RepID=A0ABU9Z7Q0_9HYPH|nr:hypothetical protein [Methylorubrum rhodesianum]MBK3403044.1 hypothetical protein [Methylorubrum rhodesianum]MBY0142148.1 hypothetical protein [Methylorubrum populi]